MLNCYLLNAVEMDAKKKKKKAVGKKRKLRNGTRVDIWWGQCG